MPERGPSRRRYLTRLGTLAGAVGVAGCTDTATDAPTTGGTGDADGTAGATDAGSPESGATGGTATPGPGTGTAAGQETTGTRGGTPIHPGYETTEVRVTTPGGELLGSVTAAIADTADLRYTGLSDTEYLPEDRGMLFVYDRERDSLTYVMRRMDFPIDIVFADSEGVITRIHHAPAPGPGEDGTDMEFPGSGQYVLEVTFEWTTDRGIEEGDILQFEL